MANMSGLLRFHSATRGTAATTAGRAHADSVVSTDGYAAAAKKGESAHEPDAKEQIGVAVDRGTWRAAERLRVSACARGVDPPAVEGVGVDLRHATRPDHR